LVIQIHILRQAGVGQRAMRQIKPVGEAGIG
jgi:hypothetical protein